MIFQMSRFSSKSEPKEKITRTPAEERIFLRIKEMCLVKKGEKEKKQELLKLYDLAKTGRELRELEDIYFFFPREELTTSTDNQGLYSFFYAIKDFFKTHSLSDASFERICDSSSADEACTILMAMPWNEKRAEYWYRTKILPCAPAEVGRCLEYILNPPLSHPLNDDLLSWSAERCLKQLLAEDSIGNSLFQSLLSWNKEKQRWDKTRVFLTDFLIKSENLGAERLISLGRTDLLSEMLLKFRNFDGEWAERSWQSVLTAGHIEEIYSVAISPYAPVEFVNEAFIYVTEHDNKGELLADAFIKTPLNGGIVKNNAFKKLSQVDITGEYIFKLVRKAAVAGKRRDRAIEMTIERDTEGDRLFHLLRHISMGDGLTKAALDKFLSKPVRKLKHTGFLVRIKTGMNADTHLAMTDKLLRDYEAASLEERDSFVFKPARKAMARFFKNLIYLIESSEHRYDEYTRQMMFMDKGGPGAPLISSWNRTNFPEKKHYLHLLGALKTEHENKQEIESGEQDFYEQIF